MSSNRVAVDEPHTSVTLDNAIPWNNLVQEAMKEHHCLKGVTCRKYSADVVTGKDEDLRCDCGRLARQHSFDEKASRVQANTDANSGSNSLILTPLTDYGQIGDYGRGVRFIRCYSEDDNIYTVLADLIKQDVKTEPSLLISCFGGAKGFEMTDKLQKEFKKGISQAAATEGVWLLTTGLNSGVSKLIGQNVHRSTLLSKRAPKPTLIGINRWGALTQRTRDVLKWQSSRQIYRTPLTTMAGKHARLAIDWNVEDTLEKHHTHFLLLDNGRVGEYLGDYPRSCFVDAICNLSKPSDSKSSQSKCQALTIIVDGGVDTLEVVEEDLSKKRSIIIIHGSGRLANSLGMLIELSDRKQALSDDDIKCHLTAQDSELESKLDEASIKRFIYRVKNILKSENRKYIYVFKLEHNSSLTDTIFKVVDNAQIDANQREKYLNLAISWNHVHLVQAGSNLLKVDRKHYAALFEQALAEDRPIFVDYFLRQNYNPLDTTAYMKESTLSVRDPKSTPRLGKEVILSDVTRIDEIFNEQVLRTTCALQTILYELYGLDEKTENSSDRWIVPQTIDDLDTNYKELIGPFTKSLYFKQTTKSRLLRSVKSECQRLCCCGKNEAMPILNIQKLKDETRHFKKPFDKQEMLRELFVWSVYTGYSHIAFVLLLQIESRITAALIGMRIAQRMSLFEKHLDRRHTFAQQAKDYEEYARACITACYEHDERLACQLLVRENPLFGDVNCMQIVIASQSIPITNTNCFMQVLTREWYGQMVDGTTATWKSQIYFLSSLVTCGFLAPFLMKYDQARNDKKQSQDYNNEKDDERSKRWEGIEEQKISNLGYWRKFVHFHSAPAVKMSYDFVIYVWFLLVFSYMMLFDMRPGEDQSHWTKIYLIIVISTMVLEELRRLIANYHTQMMERSKSSDLLSALTYATPYLLFYIGIICYYRSADRPQVLTAARVILAVDLELWYLYSLRFVSAIKLLGPKLVMIQNMTRDLAAFIYIIFVCIAAYGVVSCALTLYTTMDFTASSIFTSIFYRPYWLLYSVADDELDHLNGIISDASASEPVVEATVNHVLLAFHMIFINILILNLLIAVFNFTINDVQEKNEYFWRYQRYELTRNYFEKPILAYPPLSLIGYAIWLVRALAFRGTTFRVFKILRSTPDMDVYWTEFEEAATYDYARKFVDDTYRVKDEVTIEALMDENKRIRTDIDDMKSRMTTSLNWVMKAMKRVKMPSKDSPMPDEQLPMNT